MNDRHKKEARLSWASRGDELPWLDKRRHAIVISSLDDDDPALLARRLEPRI